MYTLPEARVSGRVYTPIAQVNMQIHPGVFQLKVPLPGNPLGFTNVYLLKTEQGSLLIDAGWDSDEGFDALAQQLAVVGTRIDELGYLVITHLHPDHAGLVGRVKQESGAQIILHAAESAMLSRVEEEQLRLYSELDRWLRTNGMPPRVRSQMQKAFSGGAGFGRHFDPDWVIGGGERLQLGSFSLEFLWTPGHSPGHIVLYEPEQRLLFAGDHVLPDTTPNISMYSESPHNPLAEYLESLRRIAPLDVDLILPGHGEPFGQLAERVEAIQAHHEARLDAMSKILTTIPKTAYQVAAESPWSLDIAWEDFPSVHQQFALTETIAHLDLLVKREKLRKTLRDGFVWYSR